MRLVLFLMTILMVPLALNAQIVVRTPSGNKILISSGKPILANMCPETLTISHLASRGVAPVDKTVTYKVVKLVLGGKDQCWITQNLGASREATSLGDATEASSGWYWQFNRKQGYKMADDGVTRTPASVWISPINENSGWTAENDPCTIELGSGWHVTKMLDWTNLGSKFGWSGSANASYWTQMYASALKLHQGGYLSWGLASLRGRGSYTRFFGNIDGIVFDAGMSNVMYTFGTDIVAIFALTEKSHAYPVRCVKDKP